MNPDKPRTSVDESSDRARALAPSLAGSTARFFEGERHRLPGVTIPMRSVLVESLSERMLISPIGTVEEARAIGTGLTTLVAPSLLHHLHLQTAIYKAQPRELWGPPGLAKKVSEFSRAKVFGRDVWPHRDVLDFIQLEGVPKLDEVVFFHAASATLFVTDLVFHMMDPKGFLTPLTFRAMGIWKKLAVPKFWKRWREDEAGLRRSLDQMLQWDFQRIVMAHGEIITVDARRKLEYALHEADLI